jgi:hypothetical protein
VACRTVIGELMSVRRLVSEVLPINKSRFKSDIKAALSASLLLA